MAAPAKTPRAIITRLNQELHAAVNSSDIKARFQELGVQPNLRSPEETRDFLVADIAKWNGVIDKAKIPRQ